MIDPWACFLGALLLLTLPLPWLLAAVAAAGFHEICHLGAIYALGGRVLSFRVGPTGAVMETEISGPWRECLAALAGPAGSLALVFTARRLPHIALCACIQGLFNLLPIYPLDGGRVLRCILAGRQRTIYILESIAALVLAGFLFRWSAFWALFLLIRVLFVKTPCKLRKLRVQ